MKNFLKIFFINCLLGILFIEAALFAYYSYENKKPVAAAALFHKHFVFDALGNRDCSWGAGAGAHPYLAIYYPKKKICTVPDRNNFGLRGTDLPLKYDPNFYTLLIAGSSVAEQTATLNADSRTNILENYLNKSWIAPNKKPFRVLNAAVAGAHQPATLIQILLFSHTADQVISLEGYNEHYLLEADLLIETPAQAWQDSVYAADSPLHFYFFQKTMFFVRAISASYFVNSYFCFAIANFFSQLFENYYAQRMQDLKPFPGPDRHWSFEQKRDFFLSRYLHYVQNVQFTLAGQKKPYTLFIQPAPYQYKQLTSEELSAVGDISHQAKYTKIKAALKTLVKKHIHVESLENIFENTNQTLYIDHIHTNNVGVQIISSAIAERLAKHYGWKNK